MTTLRHALRSDLPTVVEVWTEAFAADPFLRWIQPDDYAWPAFGEAWMRFVSSLTFERGHTYVDSSKDVAVAWVPPDLELVGPDDLARGRAVIEEHAGAERAAEAFETIVAARAHLLDVPHWTLQYIGVRPSRQSGGLGAAATATILATCDADGLPCTLISTNPRNLAFYERLGFEIAAEILTPDAAATLRPMHRDHPR